MDQQLTACVNATFIGLRVIRGQKWTLDHRGSAMMGTIIGYRSDRNQDKRYIDVRWDDGKNTTLEHPGTNTLCVLNNDTSAVWHEESCTICEGKIKGFLWKCFECVSTNLCHDCYHGKKHDLCHNFKRFDWPGHYGTTVGKRENGKTIRTQGICKKAVVEPGIDFYGQVKHLRGEVKAVVGGGSTEYRLSAVVEWSPQKSSTHQLGLQGRVELKCKKPAPGMKLYIDHLPAPWELDGMATYELLSLHPPGLKKYTPYGQVLGINPYVMSPKDRVGETNSAMQPQQLNDDDSTISDDVDNYYEDVEVKPTAAYQYKIIREDMYPDEDEVDPEEQDEEQEIYVKPDPITNSIAMVQKAYTPSRHEDEELEIREGNIILSVRDISGGWMSGYFDGKHGVFPADCVEVVCVGEQKVSEMLHREWKISSASDRERRISSTLERLDVFTNEFEKCAPVTMHIPDNGMKSVKQDILQAKMRLKPTPKSKSSPAEIQTTTEFPQSTSKPPPPPVKVSTPVAPANQNWLEEKYDFSQCMQMSEIDTASVPFKGTSVTSELSTILKPQPMPRLKLRPCKEQITTSAGPTSNQNPEPVSCLPVNAYQPEEKYEFPQCVQLPREINTASVPIKETPVASELGTVIQKPKPKPRSQPMPCLEQITTSAATILDQISEPKCCFHVNANQPKEKYEFPQSAQMPREIDTASVPIKGAPVASELSIVNLKLKPKLLLTKLKPRVEQITKSTGTNLNQNYEPWLPVNAYHPEDKTGDGRQNSVRCLKYNVNNTGEERPIPKPRKNIKTTP